MPEMTIKAKELKSPSWWDGNFTTPIHAPSEMRKQAMAWCGEGSRWFHERNYLAALNAFSRGLRACPEMTGAAYAWAFCLVRLGQIRTAATILQWEINNPAPHPKAHALLWSLLKYLTKPGTEVLPYRFGSGPPEPVLDRYAVQEMAAPAEPEAVFRRKESEGLSALAAGDAETGLQRLAELVDLFPERQMSHVIFGHGLAQIGRTEEALSSWRKSVAIAPGEPEGYLCLGRGLARLGDFRSAAAVFQHGKNNAQTSKDFLGLAEQLASGADRYVARFAKDSVPRKET